MLPASHDYVGPSVDVEELMFCLHEIDLPGPPEVPEVSDAPAPFRAPILAPGGGVSISNAPAAADIFRMRQELKSQQKK